jgi:PAS domain S-box-containing protein
MNQRVLIIDDDALTSSDIAATLRASGYEVEIVHDGPAALVVSQKIEPDIILLDLVLPSMTGIAVCAELRRLPLTRRVPILMLTARDDEDNITRAFAAGADDYITKPVRKYELVPRLGAHLRSKRLLDELEQQTRDRNLLLELQNTLASRFDLRQILRVVASRLIEAIHVERCSIILIEPGSDVGVVVVASEDPNVQDIELELKNYPEIVEAMTTRAPLVVPNADDHPVFAEVKPKQVRAAILFPMMVTSEVIGVMLLRSSQPIEQLSTRELTFGQTVASATAVAVRNARMFSGITEESVRLDVERREVAERLEIVRRFEDFISGAADGMMTMDQDGIITFANRSAAELLKIQAGEGLHIDFLAFVDAKDRERVRQMISESKGARMAEVFDVPIVLAGERRILSASISSFMHRHGATLFSFRDITAERQTAAELKKTKDFLENIINSSVDPIIVWLPSGEVVLMNEAAGSVFGYTAVEGLVATDLFGGDGAQEIMRDLRSPERGGVGKLDVSRRDVSSKRGEKIPVNFTAAIVFEDGQETAVVGIFADLRERLRIENRLSVAQEKLQMSEKQAVIAELAGTTAHELNQPLTSIMGYAELLKKKIGDEALQRPLEVIAREAERMAEIVRKIGRITRYETKTYVGSTRIVDLDRSVSEDEATGGSNKGGTS